MRSKSIKEQGSLAQCLPDKCKVELLEVAKSAVDKFA
jgi:hypothetical protein